MSGAATSATVALARELVRLPSPNPPGDERAVAAHLAEAMVAAGVGRPRVIAADRARPNLLATLDFGPGGHHLVLSGHLDTKPLGEARWSADPFAADVDGDRLLGLGAADMKGALAAMVDAAATLAGDPPPAGRLSLLFTADEENGSAAGARHIAGAAGLRADGIVIGEPGGVARDFDRMHLVSRGIARLRVRARAPQGHSSLSSSLGLRNAGVDCARATVALAHARVTTPSDAHGLDGWEATVNAGLACRGGVGYGVLPGEVSADAEVRLLPGMTPERLAADLDAALEPLRADGADLDLLPDDPPTDWLEPAAVDPADRLAAAARSACAETLGGAPVDAVFPGTTDASHLAAIAPTLPALGPGLLQRAHAADEWVSVAALETAAALYATLARRFCAP